MTRLVTLLDLENKINFVEERLHRKLTFREIELIRTLSNDSELFEELFRN